MQGVWQALGKGAPFAVALALLFLTGGDAINADLAASPTSAHFVGGVRDGQHADLSTLSVSDGGERIALTFDLSADIIGAAPLGLRLSGPYSATARWNGEVIGGKGIPAWNGDLEQPGPIDAEIAVPNALLRAGTNTLVLDLSSQAFDSGGSIINGPEGLSVRPYSADARRPLHTYLVPLILIGGLAFALVLLMRRPQSRWLAAFIAAVLIVAIAEVSRALINYPYPFHAARAAVQFGGCLVAAIALPFLAASERRTDGSMIALIGAGAIFVALAAPAADPRAATVLAFGAALALCSSIADAIERRPGAIQTSLALVLLMVFAVVDARQFLDRTLYIAALPLIFALAPRRTVTAPQIEPLERLVVGSAKRRRIVPFGQVKAVHAADKYSEFELTSGDRVLDEGALSAWSERLPSSFVRTHRSHIVNAARVSAILVLGPGKYAVEMDDCTQIPLSRSRVTALRQRIDATCGDLQTLKPDA
jgi:DNA-binding LytR/AlgR family response regulator